MMKTHYWLCEDYADNNEGYDRYLTGLALQIDREYSRENLVDQLVKQTKLTKIKEATNRDESEYDYSEENYKLVEFSHEGDSYTLIIFSKKDEDLAVAIGTIDDIYKFIDNGMKYINEHPNNI